MNMIIAHAMDIAQRAIARYSSRLDALSGTDFEFMGQQRPNPCPACSPLNRRRKASAILAETKQATMTCGCVLQDP
jgi:hypothetical protein